MLGAVGRAHAEAPGDRAPAQAPDSKAKTKLGPPEWMVLASPTFGWLKNSATFPVPVGRNGDGDLKFDEYHAEDGGWGGGLTLVGTFHRFALTNVFFMFPDVNNASLIGNVTYLSTSIPTGTFIEPYLGIGGVVVDTEAEFNDFNDVRVDDLGGLTLKGFAHMDRIAVDNQVWAVFPKPGLRIKLPIQHWYLQPFYGYLVEDVHVRARSTGGNVTLYEFDPDTGEMGATPADTIVVNPFDKTTDKVYKSHLAGTDFLIDFHYFVQLKGKVAYNVSHDLWTVRLIASMLLNKHVGVTAYFEHSQKITVTNTYFLIGPAFLFTPEGFLDEMM